MSENGLQSSKRESTTLDLYEIPEDRKSISSPQTIEENLENANKRSSLITSDPIITEVESENKDEQIKDDNDGIVTSEDNLVKLNKRMSMIEKLLKMQNSCSCKPDRHSSTLLDSACFRPTSAPSNYSKIDNFSIRQIESTFEQAEEDCTCGPTDCDCDSDDCCTDVPPMRSVSVMKGQKLLGTDSRATCRSIVRNTSHIPRAESKLSRKMPSDGLSTCTFNRNTIKRSQVRDLQDQTQKNGSVFLRVGNSKMGPKTQSSTRDYEPQNEFSGQSKMMMSRLNVSSKLGHSEFENPSRVMNQNYSPEAFAEPQDPSLFISSNVLGENSTNEEIVSSSNGASGELSNISAKSQINTIGLTTSPACKVTVAAPIAFVKEYCPPCENCEQRVCCYDCYAPCLPVNGPITCTCRHNAPCCSRPGLGGFHCYDGNSPWCEYEQEFEALAQFYGLSAEERLCILISKLRGKAFQFFNCYFRCFTPSYEQLSNVMKSSFPSNAHNFYQFFRQRVQGPQESLKDYAAQIECLANLTLKGIPHYIVVDLLKYRFIEGLRDSELRSFVLSCRPGTLCEALTYALRKPNGTQPQTSFFYVETYSQGNMYPNRESSDQQALPAPIVQTQLSSPQISLKQINNIPNRMHEEFQSRQSA